MARRTSFRPLRFIAGLSILIGIAGLIAAWYVGYFASDPITLFKPRERAGDTKIVFLSGDLGLNMGMGPRIVERIAGTGYPVVGFNSLTYFRKERSEQEVTRVVTDLMDRADQEFGPGPIVMIGQSFGADALQLALSNLAPKQRARIRSVVLVVPTDTIYMRASPAEMLNFTPADLPALPSARTLDWAPVLCIHGQAEDHSLCTLLRNRNVKVLALPGGHYLDHDVAPVVIAIERWLSTRGS